MPMLPPSRRGFARVLTLLLLFLIVVIGVVLIFTLFTGFIPGGGQSSPDKVSVSGVFATSTVGGNTATLSIFVQNLGPSSAELFAVSCPLSSFTSANCGGLTILSAGLPVSGQNVIPKGESVSGSSTVNSAIGTSFTPGKIFTFSYQVSFSDGTSISGTLQLATQT